MNLNSEISNFRCFEEYAKVRAPALLFTDHSNSKAPFVWSGIQTNAGTMNDAAFHTFLLDLGIVTGLTEVASNNIKADLNILHKREEREFELQKLILEQNKEKKSDVPIQENTNWKKVCKYAIFFIFLKKF